MSKDFEIQLSIGLVEDESQIRAIVTVEITGKRFKRLRASGRVWPGAPAC